MEYLLFLMLYITNYTLRMPKPICKHLSSSFKSLNALAMHTASTTKKCFINTSAPNCQFGVKVRFSKQAEFLTSSNLSFFKSNVNNLLQYPYPNFIVLLSIIIYGLRNVFTKITTSLSNSRLVTTMLEQIVAKIPDRKKLLLHSDQGWHYQHKQHVQMLQESGTCIASICVKKADSAGMFGGGFCMVAIEKFSKCNRWQTALWF